MGVDGIGPKVSTSSVGGTVEAKPIEKAAPAPAPAPSSPGIKARISEGFDDLKKKLMSTTGKYVAHQVSSAPRPDLDNAVAAQRSAIVGGYGSSSGVKMNATAEKEMAPIGKNEQVDMSNRDMRNHLMRSTSQVNDVSKKENNQNVICGGAAMTNALIMTSDTPAKGKANADAVRSMTNDFSTDGKPFRKPEEDLALKHMEQGKMSPTDVAHMQQLMYRTEQRMPRMVNDPSANGTSTAQVGCAAAMLKARGGLPGPNDVTFHQTKTSGPMNHWTVSSDGVHANSQAGANNDKSVVTGGPGREFQKGDPNWQNEITVHNDSPSSVSTQFRKDIDGPGGKKVPGYEEAVVDPSQFTTLNDWEKYQKAMIDADKKPPTPIE